jgi:hypothetical protein
MQPGSRRAAALEAGALFNVFVALFDTAIDGSDAGRPGLCAALAPDRLAARLRSPQSVDRRLMHPDPRLAPVCRLIDRVLAILGNRFSERTSRLAELERQLACMYASETEPGASRLAAKALPLTFICRASDELDCPQRERFYREIGHLVALLDDWDDLPADVHAGRANAFICAYDMRTLRLPAYALRAAIQIALGKRATCRQIESRLTQSLAATIDASRSLPAENRGKLLWILQRLLGKR